MAQVELQKITKIYPGGVKAVDAIDLQIRDQEFVVLVGPSGCGKSTTLRMIAGLEEISGGTIRIGQRIVNNVPPKDRDIAMVFQNYALYPHMTVYKNMAFGLKLRKMPKQQIQHRVMQAAKILDIEHLLDRKPKQLSGGQRQRVAVGRAIVREPAAFLFDEPLSNLDAKLRVTTRAELKRLHQRLKTTTIYVTHDQEEAMTLGDRIVAMKDGVIQQADTPLMTYNMPRNRFVAGFIGMPPMNFFDGAIRSVDGRLVFEEGKLTNARAAGKTTGTSDAGASDEPVVMVGELTLPGNGFRLAVPRHLERMLSQKLNQHVVLGIRPEHFHARPIASDDNAAGSEASPGAVLQMKMNVVEPLGNDMDIYMETAYNPHVVARIEAQVGLAAGVGSTAASGSSPGAGAPSGETRMMMYVDLRKVHFFEPGETGMNLSFGQNGSQSASPVAQNMQSTAQLVGVASGPNNEPAHAIA